MTTFFSFKNSSDIFEVMKKFLNRDPVEVSWVDLNKPDKRKDVIFRVAEMDDHIEIYFYNEKPEDVEKFRALVSKKYKPTESTGYNNRRQKVLIHGFYE